MPLGLMIINGHGLCKRIRLCKLAEGKPAFLKEGTFEYEDEPERRVLHS